MEFCSIIFIIDIDKKRIVIDSELICLPYLSFVVQAVGWWFSGCFFYSLIYNQYKLQKSFNFTTFLINLFNI